MAVPRNRVSNAKKNSRRAHHALKPQGVVECPNCGASCLPHRVCKQCGRYKQRVIFEVSEES